MPNALSRAAVPIAIGVCFLSAAALAAPPRYTWQRVGYVDNTDFSGPRALAEDGSAYLSSSYYSWQQTLTATTPAGDINWRQVNQPDGFYGMTASPAGVFAGWADDRIPAVYSRERGIERLPGTEGAIGGWVYGIDSTSRYLTGAINFSATEGGYVVWDRAAGTATSTGSFHPSYINRAGDSCGYIEGVREPAIRRSDGSIEMVALPDDPAAVAFSGVSMIDDAGRVMITTVAPDWWAKHYVYDGDSYRFLAEGPYFDAPGSLSVFAYNSQNQAAGRKDFGSGGEAALWIDSNGHRLADLIDGWDQTFRLASAYEMNDRGQLLVYGEVVGDLPGYATVDNTPGGFTFLLTPVPEPALAAALGVFLVASVTRRSR